MEECDEALMDFIVATEVGKFPPKLLKVWYGADAEADSGTGHGGSGFITVCFFSVCVVIF